MQLVGTEVKSLRDGQASLADSFATIDDGEVWLRNLHIPEYHHGSWTNHPPRRNRKLLLHRSQIDNLIGQDPRRQPHPGSAVAVLLRRQGQGRAGLARGKEARDKRQEWPSAMRTARSPVSSAAARKG